MSHESKITVTDIENLLVRLPAVEKARVVVNDWGAINEIHILTSALRGPKQIVRDIESALKAQWDITLDRRKISVAKVKPEVTETKGRLKYVGLEVVTDVEAAQSKIRVTLQREPDVTYFGETVSDAREDGILFGIAGAACQACNKTVEIGYGFFPEDVTVVELGGYSVVNSLVTSVTPRKNQEVFVGSAIVRKNLRSACVRATLDALNRRIQVLPARDFAVKEEYTFGLAS